jgi:hypothetical protein
MTWQELTAPAFLDADVSKVGEILSGRIDSYRMIKQYVHADGHLIWGDLSVGCLRDGAGRVQSLISQISDITAATEAQQRIAQREERNRMLSRRLKAQGDLVQAELRSAAAYVASLLPGDLAGRVRVSSRFLPSRELGGDCFDYAWVDDDHLMVYLIDVSGHGIEPALLSVSVHNLLRSGSLPPQTMLAPEKTLAELNNLFQAEKQNDHHFPRAAPFATRAPDTPPRWPFPPAELIVEPTGFPAPRCRSDSSPTSASPPEATRCRPAARFSSAATVRSRSLSPMVGNGPSTSSPACARGCSDHRTSPSMTSSRKCGV